MLPLIYKKNQNRIKMKNLYLSSIFWVSVFTAGLLAQPGTLDPSFGGDGKVTTDLGGGDDRAFSVAIQPDGKIVVAGDSYNGQDRDFALARYNIDGPFDNSFGGDGIVTTDFGGISESANSVAIQPDGKIVVGGISQSGTDYDFGLARYFSDLGVDTYNPSDTVNEVSIYPNPGSDYINVDGECMDEAQIINTLGQTLPIQIKNGQIDLHDLPNGTYLLKTETKDHGYAISKFLKIN